ncbi:uncharacterized protein V6R79_000064 [Siganus canaliculatus]
MLVEAERTPADGAALSSTRCWKESCHGSPLRSPPVAQCDETLRNNSSAAPWLLTSSYMVTTTAATEVD